LQPLLFPFIPLLLSNIFVILGTCLDFSAEARRVAERNIALEKASEGIDSLWSDTRRRCAIVLLQDRAQHIGEAVHGCRRSLTTMHSVMLPCNPLPRSFPLLLDTFRSSQRIHRLIELNLVAGANFALGWVRKWYPRLNYSSMSLSYPPGGASLRVHLENTLQPARRIIARLLREDAAFFREHHYLDVNSNVMMLMLFVYRTREFVFSNFFVRIYSQSILILVCLPQFFI
jgi:hypothetical protein